MIKLVHDRSMCQFIVALGLLRGVASQTRRRAKEKYGSIRNFATILRRHHQEKWRTINGKIRHWSHGLDLSFKVLKCHF